MKPDEQEIERLLRHAPKPAPPAGMKETLQTRASVQGANESSETALRLPAQGGWLRRWWPVLVPAGASVLAIVALAVQQIEIRSLQDSIRALTMDSTPEKAVAVSSAAPDGNNTTDSEDLGAKDRAEIERLKNRVAQLASEISVLEQAQKENEGLRATLAVSPTFTQEELDAVAKAKKRAQYIHCINNMKQIGLAVRLWALDNKDVNPPDMLSMSNELNTPKILVCPADTNRVVVASWRGFTTANCSYEYLTPSATNADQEPSRVLSRCPIHGTIGLCDGSVWGEVAKKHPEQLKTRDGKLYMEP